MLGVSYIPLFLFSTHALFFFFIFFLHFAFSKYPSSKFVNFNDKVVVTKNTSEVAFNPGVHFALFQYVYYYYFFFLSSFRTFSSTFFLKHISVENFTFSVYFCIFIFFLLLSVFFKNIFSGYRDITRSVDFFSVLWLFFFFAPFSVFANSLLTFFFFLEFGSILVILFIISSEEFFYLNSDTQAPAAAFFNSVFFQF